MAVSYEFSVGSVRVREKSLFNRTDIEQLLACNSTEEFCAALSGKGYPSGKGFDEQLGAHCESVWAYLKSVAPDFSIFTPFIIQNDAHNFKVALKGTMADREYKHLMLSPSIVEHRDIIAAVEHRNMKALPEWMAEPAAKAYDLLAHTGDSREADAALDKAVMKYMLDCADSLKSGFLKEYFRTQVFYNNVKICIRAARTGANVHYLNHSLCRFDGFDKDKIKAAAVKGIDPLLDLLSKIRDFDCAKAIEEYKKSPSAFERFTDDRLTLLAKETCKRTSEGMEPLLGYYLGEEAQKKVLLIIYSGIKTRTDAEIIRERLREIYG